MNTKHRFYLSLITALVYIIVIESSYVLNVSYLSISMYFKFIKIVFLRYILYFIITSLFLFCLSFLVNHFYKCFRHIRVYIVISLILLIIQTFLFKYMNIKLEKKILQVEIASFMAIFFATTLFFYSIYYENKMHN